MAGKGVSDQARYYDAYRWLGQQGAQRVRFFANNVMGEAAAEELRKARGWDKWKLPGYSDWIVSAPGVRGKAMGMGGGASAGPGAGGAPALGNVAANASIKAFTGGGTQDIGATNIQGVGIAVLGEFLGVDFQTADTKLPEGKSPDALNTDGMGRGGSLGPRPGLIALTPKRNEAAPSGVPVAYKGRSINMLSAAMSQSLHGTFVIGYDQSSIIGTSLASTTATYVKKLKPLWHPQKDVSHIPVKIKLTDSTAAGGIVFNVSMPLAFRKNAPVVASVDQLIVRRSSLTYPQDRDGRDDTASSIVNSKDYASWDGTSTAITDSHSSVIAGQTKYYSVWGVSQLHATPRASLRLVIA